MKRGGEAGWKAGGNGTSGITRNRPGQQQEGGSWLEAVGCGGEQR